MEICRKRPARRARTRCRPGIELSFYYFPLLLLVLGGMDELAQGSYSSQPRVHRPHRASINSQASAQTAPVNWPSQPSLNGPLQAPRHILKHHLSSNSVRSDAYVSYIPLPSFTRLEEDALDTSPSSDCSEIIAPVPLRHHILQTSESRHWLGTPPLSPYSPPISPLSTSATSPLRRQKRLSQTVSLNAIASHERTRVTSITYPAALHPYKERKPVDEGSMAKRWLRWMHHEHMKAYVVPSLILASLWVKWAVGLGSYSGLQFIRFRQCHIRLPVVAQAKGRRLCSATTRHNDTGWS